MGAACAPNRTIAGYPILAPSDYSCRSLRKGYCALSSSVGTVRREIRNHCAENKYDKAAYDTLYDALLVLSNDHSDYGFLSNEYQNYVFKQVLPPTIRPPLQLYPRLTHPHLATLAEINDSEVGWLVPFILNEKGLAGRAPTRFRAFLARLGFKPKAARISAAGLRESFAFWLEPRDREGQQKECWVPIEPRSLEDIHVGIDGTCYNPVRPDSSTRGLIFDVSKPRQAAGESESTRGFYHIRVLPKLPAVGHAYESDYGNHLADGDWYSARKYLDGLLAHDRGGGASEFKKLVCDLRRLEASIRTITGGYGGRRDLGYVHAPLNKFRRACHSLHKQLEKSHGYLSFGVGQALRDTAQAIDLVMRNESPAPVYLDDGDADQPYSFIVAADLQYHKDRAEVSNFFAYVQGDPCKTTRFRELSPSTQEAILDAKFVLIAGDLCDGAAGSARRIFGNRFPGQMFFNGLGVLPPSSPYSYAFPGFPGREMINLRDHLRDLKKPVFGVPGNHDGIVGYGGVISFFLDATAEFLNEIEIPFIRNGLARILFRGNEFIPHGFKFYADTTAPPVTLAMIPRQSRAGRVVTPRQGDGILSWFYAPRYDGLVEWRWFFGPLNVAFDFRGCRFIGANSYNLSQPDRAGVGAVVSNWGGGVQPRDAVWLRFMLNDAAAGVWSKQNKQHVVFMHHDPRGLTPMEDVVDSNVEPRTPAYDATDAWGNYLTIGYGGLQYSPAWGLYWPIISPLGEHLLHCVFYHDRWNREWTKGYGEAEIVDLIDSLATTKNVKTVNLFLGHNDVPVDGLSWRQDKKLYPIASTEKCMGRKIGEWLFRLRDTSRPAWADRIESPNTGVDIEVTRLDDAASVFEYGTEKERPQGEAHLSESKHGFSLVTVYPKSARVCVKHIPIASSN